MIVKSIKYSILMGMMMAGLIFFIADAVARDEATTLAGSAFSDAERTRPAVLFYHDDHNEMAEIAECNTCHHRFKDGKKLTDEDSVGMECASCHWDGAGSDIIDLIRVYHLQCRTCHLQRKSGPILCGQCHRDPP